MESVMVEYYFLGLLIIVIVQGSVNYLVIDKFKQQALERFKLTSATIDIVDRRVVNIQKELNNHLEKVKEVIAAAMPYMQSKELTPENVVKAFEEMQEDNDINMEEATRQLDNLVGGSDF